jgi:hypothetical protein
MKVMVEMTMAEYEEFKNLEFWYKKYNRALRGIADLFQASGCEVCGEMRIIAIRALNRE